MQILTSYMYVHTYTDIHICDYIIVIPRIQGTDTDLQHNPCPLPTHTQRQTRTGDGLLHHGVVIHVEHDAVDVHDSVGHGGPLGLGAAWGATSTHHASMCMCTEC